MMQRIFRCYSFPLRLLIQWMLLFVLFRVALLFVMIQWKPTANFSGWPYAFVAGLQLDLSAASYLSVIPLLLRVFLFRLNDGGIKIIRIICYIELLVLALLFPAVLATYKAWGTLVNARALSFIADPDAILASVSTLQIASAIMASAFMFITGYIIFSKWTLKAFDQTEKCRYPIIHYLTALMLLPIGIRGGLQQIPINESSAAWSEHQYLNHLAMNPLWYLGNNVYKSSDITKNPYVYMKQEVADSLFKMNAANESADTLRLFNVSKPNIILVVLESFTSDLISKSGGDASTTPFFNAICDSGLFFENIYASGRRTDQMFPSVLSGFPAQPDHSIVRYPDKTEKLPKISADLKHNGYHTSFFYGGELGFANMNTFLLQGEFEKITGKNNFDRKQWNSKWGAHDEYVLKRQAEYLAHEQEPFFSMVLTLTTHEPFEIPHADFITGDDEHSRFRNAAAYTDMCLRNFYNTVSASDRSDQTVFIFVADHGHPLPMKREYMDPACHHIPLLVIGKGLKQEWRGKTISVTGSQHDIAATLLNQLSMDAGKYTYSRDLLSENHPGTAYLNMDEAAGWKYKDGSVVMHLSDGVIIPQFSIQGSQVNSNASNELKAYLQHLFNQFISL